MFYCVSEFVPFVGGDMWVGVLARVCMFMWKPTVIPQAVQFV